MQVQDESEMPIGNEIINQTDRASAIISSAYLEDKLTLMLRKYLTRDAPTIEIFERMTDAPGQLGALGTKTDLAYLLGLFGPLTHKDLKLISKIRNQFAHLSTVLDFGDQSILNRCQELKVRDLLWSRYPAYKEYLEYPRPFTKEIARRAFIASVSLFSNKFTAIAKSPEILKLDPLG